MKKHQQRKSREHQKPYFHPSNPNFKAIPGDPIGDPIALFLEAKPQVILFEILKIGDNIHRTSCINN